MAARFCSAGGRHVRHRGRRIPSPHGAGNRWIEHTRGAREACTERNRRHAVRRRARGGWTNSASARPDADGDQVLMTADGNGGRVETRRTYTPRASEVTHKWVVLDAAG